MKKSVAIILAVVLVCALLVVGVAAGGAKSPTQKGTTGAGEGASDVVITSALDAEGEVAEAIEAAKAEFEANADDLSKLCADLAGIEGLSVLDIINVSWGEETEAIVKEKGGVSVKFDTKLGSDAKAFLLFKENNAWSGIESTIEGGSVVATLSKQGLYAIVVG